MPVYLLLILLFVSSCSNDLAILKEKREQSPTLRISYWGEDWKLADLKDRIRECPAELVEKIRIENKIASLKEKPTPVRPTAEISLALQSIETSMPDNIKKILRQRLVGIFTVKDLGGTGYADIVYDAGGKEKYGIIVLDEAVLMSRNANDWATWKENGFFNHRTTGDVKVRVTIEEQGNNTVVNAVRYIMLHEMGHILGMVTQAHPSWIEGREKTEKRDYPFLKLSWKRDAYKDRSSLFEDAFPERKLVSAYSFDRSRLSVDHAPQVYEKLRNYTNFPSLAASQNVWEDFAECFVNYFHTTIDKRPWEIAIERDGVKDISMGACWKEDRCKTKYEFMRKWVETVSVQ